MRDLLAAESVWVFGVVPVSDALVDGGREGEDFGEGTPAYPASG